MKWNLLVIVPMICEYQICECFWGVMHFSQKISSLCIAHKKYAIIEGREPFRTLVSSSLFQFNKGPQKYGVLNLWIISFDRKTIV